MLTNIMKAAVCDEKEYKVRNLGKYLSKSKKLIPDGMNSARAKAQKSISDMVVDYWSEDVTLDKSVICGGDYLQGCKRQRRFILKLHYEV